MDNDDDGIAGGHDVDDLSTEAAGMPRILVDLANGTLSADETDAVVRWLSTSADEEPPSWVVNRAIRIAGQQRPEESPRLSVWRRLVAALVYDNRLQPRMAGIRSAATDQPRLLYQAGGIEIDLEVGSSSIAGRLRVLGQVMASEPDLVQAWVVAEGPSGRVESEVDQLGQFAIDGLLSGVHRVEIGLARDLIEIPAVEI